MARTLAVSFPMPVLAPDDDDLVREVGDVLYAKSRFGRESLAEPGPESTHDDQR
jgi:hypothetical protein